MPKEYEHQFYNFDKKQIISKIQSLNGTYKGTYLFKIQKFVHPLNILNTYVRVRDEGYRITMTYKDIYANEEEVIINNFDDGVSLLVGLGCKKLYYFEKIREIWEIEKTTKQISNLPTDQSKRAYTEIIFDTSPCIAEIMEVESKTKGELDKILKYFELIPLKNRQDNYKELFGITMPKAIDLTFKTVKKELSQYVTKNNKEFIKLCNEQVKNYQKLSKIK